MPADGRWAFKGLNQSIIYIHPFPSTLTPVLLFVLLQPIAPKKNSGRKNYGVAFAPISPSTIYGYALEGGMDTLFRNVGH